MVSVPAAARNGNVQGRATQITCSFDLPAFADDLPNHEERRFGTRLPRGLRSAW